ncbi:MAG: ABC transporter substrate-binding protein [Xanthobacteraceae bacterium]
MRKLMVTIASLISSISVSSAEIANDKVRIGLLSDLSGPYEADTGNGSVLAAQIAAEEFGNRVNGVPIEILAADHQNKPDVGAAIANKWFDIDKVDAISDLVNSAVAMAVVDVAKQKNKAALLVGAGSADFTGKACAPDTLVHWAYDTYMLANANGGMVPALGRKWFMISADYVFGKALAASVKTAVEKNGGEIIGSVLHPIGTTDFSSYVLQAQASKADVVIFNNGGDDTTNAVKTAKEFGLVDRQKVVATLDNPRQLKAIGLDTAQKMTYAVAWHRELGEKTAAFARKFLERSPNKVPPSMMHAGNYSAVRSYILGVAAANSTDPKAVFAKMREMQIDDAFTPNGKLRPDGRMVHDAYMMQVKTPAESRGEWDQVEQIGVIPADKAFRSIVDGGCPAMANRSNL